jgi:MFS superfamily sulfate permease-like transporter
MRQAVAITDPPPRVILLDGESINNIDATAVITLKELQERVWQTEPIELRFASMKTNVREIMDRGGLLDAIPEDHFYPSIQSAVDAFLAEQ